MMGLANGGVDFRLVGTCMTVSSAWQRYEAWNQALAYVLFTTANGGRPVYLDMDEDVLARVAVEAGAEQADAAEQLAVTVRDTLNLHSGTGPVFGQHLRNLRLWRRVRLKNARDDGEVPSEPPVLSLLAVLTLAAEEMQHDRDFAGNAYYPRLFRLLHLDDERQQSRLTAAYRRDAEELWGGLNEWLSASDGRLGLPTAYALSHRYIGLPLSQALVRDVDRLQFPFMFLRYGLPPGGEIAPADMERLLDSWLQMRPCPVSKNLESLWNRGQARDRIASVAAIELRSWDGALPESAELGARKAGSVHLVCWLRNFPRRKLDISFLAGFGAQATPQSLKVMTAPGEPDVEMVPVPGARLQPVFTSEIDSASLVEGILRLADGTGLEATRFPRRVVPFRYDDLLNALVECERVQLGEDSLLLVKDAKGLPAAVRVVLTETARPGFREETALPGLPDGWVVFAGVQVVTAPNREPSGTDLNVLVPLLSAQLAFADGTKLPGQLRKWSSLDPPEIRAIVQGASHLSVRLTPLHDMSDAPEASRTWTSDATAIVVDLSGLGLRDGDYEVSLDDKGKPVQQAILRLRSSDTPDVAILHAVTHLVHDLAGDRLAVLRATPLRPSALADAEVRGPYSAPLRTAPAMASAAGREVWWNSPKPLPPPKQQPITLTALDPTSCVVTGAHHIELPIAYGKTKGVLITGTCKYCGLVKRYPAHIRWSRDSPARAAGHVTPLHVNASQLPDVSDGHSSWDVAVDSLVHASGGNYPTLEYVAGQVEGSPLFTDTFTRSLEARSDLEIERGNDFIPVRWEMSPPYLAELATGGFLLAGSWSRGDREELQALVTKAGGTLTAGHDRYGLGRYLVTEVAASELAEICGNIGTAGVVEDAGSRLVRALPPLSGLEAALPRVPLPATNRIQRFHLESSSWVPAASAEEPGAYQLDRGFTRTDVFRAPGDVEAGTAALGTVQLTKHLAARHAGRALLAYDAGQQVLAVPLGADLPGLYGRAAVLCGGLLPAPDEVKPLLVYRGVPLHVANALNSLLTS